MKLVKAHGNAKGKQMGQRSPNGTKEPESDETGQGCPKG